MRTTVRFAVAALVIGACGPSNHGPRDGGGGDAYVPLCTSDSQDLEGCSCTAGSAPRACYPHDADPSTRNTGGCHDGTQSCSATGEFAMWGACTGATTPPMCAACSAGQTRPCYDGPMDTEGVGICKDGMQTCVNGQWPTNCPGEVLPQQPDCSSPVDVACNHLPGCFNIFVCASSPACMQTCKLTDPSCVCPTGNGDTATCPDGMHGVTMGGFPGTVECCPCTANDCGDPNCCAESVCASNAACGGLTCTTLPPSCMGQVNFDCDDFPEDCDEPCCRCSMCP
jgi:hypothetical protein